MHRLLVYILIFVLKLNKLNLILKGHLAGILVGLLYIYGPVKYILDLIVPTSTTKLIFFIFKFLSLFFFKMKIDNLGKIDEHGGCKMVNGSIMINFYHH